MDTLRTQLKENNMCGIMHGDTANGRITLFKLDNVFIYIM